MSLFLDFIGGMRWFLVQGHIGQSATMTCDRCLQRACSSTYKASLAMALLWIWQW
jgi:hypothetical protein